MNDWEWRILGVLTVAVGAIGLAIKQAGWHGFWTDTWMTIKYSFVDEPEDDGREEGS